MEQKTDASPTYISFSTPPVLWTQPTFVRLESTSQLKNLDVYPNPTRDIFNIRFVSEKNTRFKC